MDISKIEEIVNSEYTHAQKRMKILHCIAEDEKAIPTIMEILNIEREDKREALMDMNLELSRAHIYIDKFKPKQIEKEAFNQNFVLGKIAAFYNKYKGKINHCFNRFN